eukprot:5526382-Amphidinium_carterae.1
MVWQRPQLSCLPRSLVLLGGRVLGAAAGEETLNGSCVAATCRACGGQEHAVNAGTLSSRVL